MGRARALKKEDVAEGVRPIYEEIEKAFGRIPNIFKTYAHYPPLLKSNREKFEALMMGGLARQRTQVGHCSGSL